MTTQTEIDARLQIMVEAVKEQALIDKLSALALIGKVNWYQAKAAVEDADWNLAGQLIQEAQDDG